ncbi:MAG: hypothetical protein ACTSYL_05295 [Candidatus Thorarchaeota archaeon]
MVSKLLILGMIPFDSGKTSLAIQIAEYLRSQERRTEYFKPVSGHNYWYRYAHTQECINTGQLVSYDATRVRKEIGSNISPLIVNPVHSLFVPARLERPGRAYLSTLGLAGWDSFLALQRISIAKNNEIQNKMAMARGLIEKRKLIITEEEANALAADSEIVEVSSLEEAREFECAFFETAVNNAFRFVAGEADYVVIESFNDSVWPWEGLEVVDNVLVVGPGQVFIYDPTRIRKAAFLAKRGEAPIREVTFSRIEDMLLPLDRIELHPQKGIDTKLIRSLIDE